MSDEHLREIQNLLAEFAEMSLANFRDAFLPLVRDKNPTIDRFLVDELKNFRGNRAMRAVIASALAEREDESYLEDFASVVEKETDVSLCKECINGLTRLGTQEAVQKIEFLAKSKPNATIASLLKQELDKIRHEEKEPVTYYIDNLAKGNENARNCIHASKVLVKMGKVKAVDDILANFHNWDDLGRAEGAKVVARLGTTEHLSALLDILDRYRGTHLANTNFLETAEEFGAAPKEDRIELLKGHLKKVCTTEQETAVQSFMDALDALDLGQAATIKDQVLEMDKPVGLEYLMESLLMILDNKIAHANKYHEEQLRAGRVRQSRLRHLVAECAYGIGKIAGGYEDDDALRARAVDRMITLVQSPDSDVCKQALFGTAFFVRPGDVDLLDATLATTQLEGMTRLLRVLERNTRYNFTDFFLNVAMNHEILDIQEMAMQALGNTPEVHEKVRAMLSNDDPETKRTAIRIIGEIRSSEFKEDLLGLLEGQSDIIRIQAITSLGKMGEEDVLDRINDVMYDAKSIVLIEVCLKAMAQIGTDEAIQRLHEFSEKTRNKKTAIIAIQLLVQAYRNWSKPLPESSDETLLKHLATWFEDRDSEIRRDSYRIASYVISLNIDLYNKFKQMFKDASSKLRAQANWDKEEMALVDESVRIVNRNFFFLKDMLAFHEEVENRCRNHDNDSSTVRVGVYEKLIKYLENNEKFLLSEANEADLEKVVFTGLELQSGSWREQGLLFKVASFADSEKIKEELIGRLKTVPKQARNDLMDALARLGLGLKEIKEFTAIKDVLVMEGSGFYRKRVVGFLKKNGYDVRDTSDCEMGAAMVQSKAPDLIITELVFGTSLEGVDFCEKIAKEYGAGRIQIIVSTNNRDGAVLERIGKLNPMAVFHKPYPLEKLVETIKG